MKYLKAAQGSINRLDVCWTKVRFFFVWDDNRRIKQRGGGRGAYFNVKKESILVKYWLTRNNNCLKRCPCVMAIVMGDRCSQTAPRSVTQRGEINPAGQSVFQYLTHDINWGIPLPPPKGLNYTAGSGWRHCVGCSVHVRGLHPMSWKKSVKIYIFFKL